MRMSDWSSDVCSSDLSIPEIDATRQRLGLHFDPTVAISVEHRHHCLAADVRPYRALRSAQFDPRDIRHLDDAKRILDRIGRKRHATAMNDGAARDPAAVYVSRSTLRIAQVNGGVAWQHRHVA